MILFYRRPCFHDPSLEKPFFNILPHISSARARARADANARGLLHTKPTKLATLTHEVIHMKNWKVNIPQRKTDYQKLKKAAEAIEGED